jgi:periplasmic divalent cation tolerance protein
MSDLRLVYVTCPDFNVAEAIARALLEARLIACANLLPTATSVYRWKGAIESAAEVILIAKTTEALSSVVMNSVKALHPYETPAILCLAPEAVDPAFAAWVMSETGPLS